MKPRLSSPRTIALGLVLAIGLPASQTPGQIREQRTCIVDKFDFLLAKAELERAQAWYARFGSIWFSPHDKQPLFVSQSGTTSRLQIHQMDGGRDAKYITMHLPWRPRAIKRLEDELPARENIGYRPEVAGTDIIYDVISECLQGKARPFAVEVKHSETLVYALLPVQIEAVVPRVVATPGGPMLQVEFHDAQGERLQAALPFHLAVRSAGGEMLKGGYTVTERDGRYVSGPVLFAGVGDDARITVRSQLTGREETISLSSIK